MRILISACLLGCRCRYDGGANGPLPQLQALLSRHTLIPVCPEQLGGLPTPRPPAERCGDRVITRDGGDVTGQFRRGAQQTLELARRLGCTAAILKARSPSCGSGKIYDGTFSHTQVPGWGVTAQLLREAGLQVLDETQLDSLLPELSGKVQPD